MRFEIRYLIVKTLILCGFFASISCGVNATGETQPNVAISATPTFRGVAYLSTNPTDAMSQLADLTLIDIDTREKKILASGHISEPLSWSAINQKLLFAATEDGSYESLELFTVDLNGNKTQLTENQVTDTGAIWSPNGKSIIFFSRRLDGNRGAYYLMNAMGGDVRQVIEDEAININNIGWSLDGQRLALGVTESSNGNWQNRIDGFRIITTDLSEIFVELSDGRLRNGLSWSPSGKYVAYVSDMEVHERHFVPIFKTLNTFDTTTQKDAQIAEFEQIGVSVYSPVTDEIAFTASTSQFPETDEEFLSFEMNVYVVNSDGSNLRQLIKGGVYSIGAWTSDGKSIIITSSSIATSNLSEVVILNVDTKELEVLATDAVFSLQATWVEY